MTPEQKELEVQSLEAQLAWHNSPKENKPKLQYNSPSWLGEAVWEKGWTDWPIQSAPSGHYYRLAPPAEIPWHNPEGVTQEQLEPEKGWRFCLKDEECNIPHEGWYGSWVGWKSCFQSVGTWFREHEMTYRTREPLPAKYQHLVPESKEARARRLLLEVPQKEGYGPWEYMGAGPVDDQIDEGDFLIAYTNEAHSWVLSHHGGLCESRYYARARKLPTEKEKAEAALNAYKLEPGERLVHRGSEWDPGDERTYLYFEHGRVTRMDRFRPSGQTGWYAEIIKEPELVPFTQETFPLGAWIKGATGVPGLPTVVHSEGVFLSNNKFFGFQEMLDQSMLISTDSGTTWIRAGKGVEK